MAVVYGSKLAENIYKDYPNTHLFAELAAQAFRDEPVLNVDSAADLPAIHDAQRFASVCKRRLIIEVH